MLNVELQLLFLSLVTKATIIKQVLRNIAQLEIWLYTNAYAIKMHIHGSLTLAIGTEDGFNASNNRAFNDNYPCEQSTAPRTDEISWSTDLVSSHLSHTIECLWPQEAWKCLSSADNACAWQWSAQGLPSVTCSL